MRTPRLRLLSAILAVAMFFTLLPVSALAEGGGSTGVSHVATRSLNTDNKDDQGLTYTLHADHTATVASYDDSAPDGVIDIPDTVISGGQPYTVTAIGVYAFNPSRTTTKVSSVFIPATVTSIGRFAFRCCKFLATVTFAEGSQLKSIGVSVNCTPFVRQYGILFRKWGVFVCQKRKNKRHMPENSKSKPLKQCEMKI